MKNNFEIGFVGLSHLGFKCLAAAAQKNSVIGIHRIKDKLMKLKNLIYHFQTEIKKSIKKK